MPQNRLISSSSAYLKSAGNQPVDWHEFDDAAFEKAKKLDRLVLLDIGARWCHWCHVIDRESYEDEEIARLINGNYIAVKVDRDQRPDIDVRYQQIVASMTGQGGWPLTVFLTYDGRVLYGGTYFPPDMMKKLLVQLKDIYQEEKEEIMKESLEKTLPEELQKQLRISELENIKPVSSDIFQRIINAVSNSFDPINGGFGNYPKFPHFSTLEFLILMLYRTKNNELTGLIEQTLTKMAQGGMHDQIGGGFHRYSVDNKWHLPHFEKMAYDNAEALKVYARAYSLYKKPLYLNVVKGILGFTTEVLSDQTNGGFYASQDADIDANDDGDYFTWTSEGVKSIMSEEEAEAIMLYYDITASGDLDDRPGRNVLFIAKSVGDVTEAVNRPIETVKRQIRSAVEKMALKRRSKPAPFVDTTQYLNWNGMYLASYFETADLLGRSDVRQFAEKTLDRLLKTHVDSFASRLLHTKGVTGFIEDYAWMIYALIKGYQSTGKTKYLDAAKHWTSITCKEFEDQELGGFYDIMEPPRKGSLVLLKLRRKPTEDTPSSSPNSIMIRNLVHLHLITGEESYRKTAGKALGTLGKELYSLGLFASSLGIALFEYMYPPLKIEVLGKDAELEDAARKIFYPGKVISYLADTHPPKGQLRICEGTRCLSPVTTVAELESELQNTLGIKLS